MQNDLQTQDYGMNPEPPVNEPQRQLYYIQKARELTRMSFEGTDSPAYYLETFGCQMNEKQSEVIAGILEEIGYTRVRRRK